jgi:hypothetical protein
MLVLCAAGVAKVDILLRILAVETNVVQCLLQVCGAHHTCVVVWDIKSA